MTNADGEPVSATTFKLNWLSAAGTLLLISGLLTMLALKCRPAARSASTAASLDQLKWATLTVAAVLALAYVMNLSGQTITLGLWIAGAGGILAFLSSIIGWLGVAVTGSDTSSNSLFGALQVSAAQGGRARPDAARGGELLRRRARARWSRRRTSRSAPPRSGSAAARASCSGACSAGASCCC